MGRLYDGLIQLFRLRDGWSKDVRKSCRFVLLAVTPYLAYSIWVIFNGFSGDSVDEIVVQMFQGFPGTAIGVTYFARALLGLYLSLIAGAVAKSLLPDP